MNTIVSSPPEAGETKYSLDPLAVHLGEYAFDVNVTVAGVRRREIRITMR